MMPVLLECKNKIINEKLKNLECQQYIYSSSASSTFEKRTFQQMVQDQSILLRHDSSKTADTIVQ